MLKRVTSTCPKMSFRNAVWGSSCDSKTTENRGF